MKSITFTCKTITPMFLSGADGQTPELRPPSIKGAMRFWWRAMNGHLATKENNEFNYLSLKNTEQSIFGGTGGFKIRNDKTDALKSKFSTRVSNMSNNIPVTIQKSDFDGKGGLEYFFYLISAGMTENNKALKNTRFDVIISADEENALLDACASFWLLTYFGGLGSRARRGGGSFCITRVIDEKNILKDKLRMSPSDNAKDFLSKGLKDVAKIIQKDRGELISNKYSTVQSSHIYVSTNGKSDWKEALNEIGKMMKEVRTDTERDASLRTQTQATLNQKAAFGLPISVRMEKNVVEFKKKDDFNHRASPIIISIAKLDNKFYWTLVHLQGEFMPPDTTIEFKSKTKGSLTWNNEDDKLLKVLLIKLLLKA